MGYLLEESKKEMGEFPVLERRRQIYKIVQKVKIDWIRSLKLRQDKDFLAQAVRCLVAPSAERIGEGGRNEQTGFSFGPLTPKSDATGGRFVMYTK